MLSGSSFFCTVRREKNDSEGIDKTESSLSKLYDYRKTLTERKKKKMGKSSFDKGAFALCGLPLCNRQDLILAEKKECEWFTHGFQQCPR